MTERYHYYRQLNMEQAQPEFLQRGAATTKFWSRWFQGPLSDATIPLSVRVGPANLDADLKFYFREAPQGSPSSSGNGAGNNGGGEQWWNLCVGLRSSSKAIIQFRLEIDLVDQGRNVIRGEGNSIRKVLIFPDGTEGQDPMLVVKEKFVQREREGAVVAVGSSQTPDRAESMLKISVTPMFIMPEEVNVDDDEGSLVAISLPRTRRNMYTDLKLQTRDNRVIHCHRIILGARSKVLDALIQYVEGNFDVNTRSITLGVDVNAKPMNVILHWMYTGEEELQPEVWDCLKEVLDAAILFELTPFFKILDRKLITICNRGNMVQLFRIAQTKKMDNARAAISKFIKEQLSGDANQLVPN